MVRAGGENGQDRLAKGLNKIWNHVCQVFKERFYSRALRSPREVRNVLRYLLNNGRRHQQHLDPARPDPFSSGPAFDGWSNYCPESLGEQAMREKAKWLGPNGLIARARCWLLTTGWRRHGLIGLVEAPASGP